MTTPAWTWRYALHRSAVRMVLGLALGLVIDVSSVRADTREAISMPPTCGRVAPLVECARDSPCRGLVFLIDDGWHGLAGCLRSLRNIWSSRGPQANVSVGSSTISVSDIVMRQVRAELTQAHVRLIDREGQPRSFDEFFDEEAHIRRPLRTAVRLNDLGQAYNAMGQSGTGYFLLQFAALASADNSASSSVASTFYRAVGAASLDAIVRSVDEGGLSSTADCAKAPDLTCTWFHSITRRDRSAASGATLNQHLHAVRDLFLSGETGRERDWTGWQGWRLAATAGVRQLFLGDPASNLAPTLDDFLAPAEGLAGVRWSYYGFDLARRHGYFLDRRGLDCWYHVHSLDLMAQIISLVRKDETAWSAISRDVEACDGPLDAMRETARVRLNSDRHEDWSRRGSRRDYACNATAISTLPLTLSSLEPRFASCCVACSDEAPASTSRVIR